MNVLSRLSIHGLAVVSALNFMPVNAFAQSQSLDDCSCLVPARAAGQPIGSIVAVEGQVQVSGATGFTNSKAGTMLIGGNRVIVGPRSSASLSLGSRCPLQVSANQDVALDPVKTKICVRVLDRTTTAVVELPTLSSTSAQIYSGFLLHELISTPVVGATAIPTAITVPNEKPRQIGELAPAPDETTVATDNAVYPAATDTEPVNGTPGTPGGAPAGGAGGGGGGGGAGNSLALVVLGLAATGGIVAVALSGKKSASD